ncbi:hypothetical protein A8U91_00264 [Halomonas elongata]|uniref:Uncharacterized protein n=1 Tax=Halomonas elongata TaxID=2746 RepID=A0A1B8P134_HALEL|nr:hypothetical protein [Halomonas elongata]OBX35928.1 hypothetical protein A8U91_00264 [Halomonas elongata]
MNDMTQMSSGLSLSKRLKQATQDQHERVDQAIRDLQPFATRAGYVEFLKVQYLFSAIPPPSMKRRRSWHGFPICRNEAVTTRFGATART